MASSSSSNREVPKLTMAIALAGGAPVNPETLSSFPMATSLAARSSAHWARMVRADQLPHYGSSTLAVRLAARPALQVQSATQLDCLHPNSAWLATITPTEAASTQVAAARARGAHEIAAACKDPFSLTCKPNITCVPCAVGLSK